MLAFFAEFMKRYGLLSAWDFIKVLINLFVRNFSAFLFGC